MKTGRIVVIAALCFAFLGVRGAAAVTPLDMSHAWSCSPAQVYLEPIANEVQAQAVLRAALQWHKAFRPDWTFTSDPTRAAVRVRVARTAEDHRSQALLAATGNQYVSADVTIDPDETDYGKAARHELGHVGGLGHSTSQWDAMGPFPLVDHYSVNEVVELIVSGRHCVAGTSTQV